MAQSGPAQGGPRSDPAWVATEFLKRYYEVLAKHPKYLNRFYKDDSQFTLTIHDHGASTRETVCTTTAIQEKVNATVQGAVITIEHSEAQYSLGSGVLLQVAGRLSLPQEAGLERRYTQIFFLAPQEKGYFVLNDIMCVHAGLSTSEPAAAAGENGFAPAAAAAPAPPASQQQQQPQQVQQPPQQQAPPPPPQQQHQQAPPPQQQVQPMQPPPAAAAAALEPAAGPSPAAPAAPAPAGSQQPAAVAAQPQPSQQQPQQPLLPADLEPAPAAAAAAPLPAAEPEPSAAPAPAGPQQPAAPDAPAEPAAPPKQPLSYAERLKLGKPAPPPSSAPPPRPVSAVAAAAAAAAAGASPDASGSDPAASARAAAPEAAAAGEQQQQQQQQQSAPQQAQTLPLHLRPAVPIGWCSAATDADSPGFETLGIYLRGIPAATTRDDLARLFEGYGRLANVSVVASRTHDTNTAYVDYERPGPVAQVLADYSKKPLIIGGVAVTVLPKIPKVHRTIGPGRGGSRGMGPDGLRRGMGASGAFGRGDGRGRGRGEAGPRSLEGGRGGGGGLEGGRGGGRGSGSGDGRGAPGGRGAGRGLGGAGAGADGRGRGGGAPARTEGRGPRPAV